MPNMDYREVLKSEFAKRRLENPFYSLRNFAKDLQLHPSHLSRLLKGQRGLSRKSASYIAIKIGLKSFAATRFCFLVSEKSGRSRKEKTLARLGLQKKFIKEAESKLQEFCGNH